MVKYILIVGAVIVLILIGWNTMGRSASTIVLPTPQPEAVSQGQHTESTVAPSIQPETSPMKTKQYTQVPALIIDPKKAYTAVLTTSKGPMNVKLFAQDAPQTVNNFVFLARSGFYDKTVFHRIVKNFMIQGGDPEGTGRGGPGYTFPDEPVTKSYTRGTIAMANRGPDTNGSQFFIVHTGADLPKQYVIFGTIDESDTQSLQTLDAIATIPVEYSDSGELSRPVDPVELSKVEIKE